MTIDLTGPVPRLLPSADACEACASSGELFRLIGTATALCGRCFAQEHS